MCPPRRPEAIRSTPLGFGAGSQQKRSLSLLLEHRRGCTSARCESSKMSSRWELMKHRDPERLQMAAATEDRALEKQGEAQARQHEEREAEECLQVRWSRARGKPENHSDLDLRTNGTVQVVAAMCQQPRGTLPATEPGALELHSRKSSSRMLMHKLAVTYVPEPCSLLEQATMARLPQPCSVLLHCPKQPETLRSFFPTPTHFFTALKR